MNDPFTIDEIKKVPTNILLEQVFPENRVLLKDSGLWMVYEGDDYNDCVSFQQEVGEKFSDFIARAIHHMICDEQPDEDGGKWGIGVGFITATIVAKDAQI